MLEADVVASHALDAGFLTPRAPWLAIIAYSKAGNRSAQSKDF
jgi:hypothetical protein